MTLQPLRTIFRKWKRCEVAGLCIEGSGKPVSNKQQTTRTTWVRATSCSLLTSSLPDFSIQEQDSTLKSLCLHKYSIVCSTYSKTKMDSRSSVANFSRLSSNFYISVGFYPLNRPRLSSKISFTQKGSEFFLNFPHRKQKWPQKTARLFGKYHLDCHGASAPRNDDSKSRLEEPVFLLSANPTTPIKEMYKKKDCERQFTLLKTFSKMSKSFQ